MINSNNNKTKHRAKVKKQLLSLKRCNKCHLFLRKQQNKKLKICRCYDISTSSSSGLEIFNNSDSTFSSSLLGGQHSSFIANQEFIGNNANISNADSTGVVCIGDVCVLKE